MERPVTPLTGVARAKYMRDLTRKINNLHDKADIVDNLRTRLHISKPDMGKNRKKKRKSESKASVKLERNDFNQDYVIQRMKFLKQNIETVNEAVNTKPKSTIWRNKFEQFKDKSCEIEKQKLKQLYKADIRNFKKELIREPKPETEPVQSSDTTQADDTTCPVQVLIKDKDNSATPVHGSIEKSDDRDTTYPVHALIKSPLDTTSCPLHIRDNSNRAAIICPVNILISTPDNESNTCPVHTRADSTETSTTQIHSLSPSTEACPIHTLINHPITEAIVQHFQPTDQPIQSTPTSPIPDIDPDTHDKAVQICENRLQNITSTALVPSDKVPNRRICLRNKRFKRYVTKSFCAHCHDLITEVAYCNRKQQLCYECADKHFYRATTARFSDRPMGYKEFKIVSGDTIYNQN